MKRNFEKVINQALELYDRGEPVDSIVAQFPKHQADLEAVFAAISAMQKDSITVRPSKESLAQVILSLKDKPKRPAFSIVDLLSQSRITYVGLAMLILAIGALGVLSLVPAFDSNQFTTMTADDLARDVMPLSESQSTDLVLIETGPTNVGEVEIATLNQLAVEMNSELVTLSSDIEELETIAMDTSINTMANALFDL